MRERRVHCASRHGSFTHDIEDGRGHRLVADEPVDAGGSDLGMSPFELLASGLAACTSITILVYARDKGMALDDVKVTVDYVRAAEGVGTGAGPDRAERAITLIGALDPALVPRFLRVARACPVHKLLEKAGVAVTDRLEIQASDR